MKHHILAIVGFTGFLAMSCNRGNDSSTVQSGTLEASADGQTALLSVDLQVPPEQIPNARVVTVQFADAGDKKVPPCDPGQNCAVIPPPACDPGVNCVVLPPPCDPGQNCVVDSRNPDPTKPVVDNKNPDPTKPVVLALDNSRNPDPTKPVVDDKSPDPTKPLNFVVAKSNRVYIRLPIRFIPANILAMAKIGGPQPDANDPPNCGGCATQPHEFVVKVNMLPTQQVGLSLDGAQPVEFSIIAKGALKK